MHRISKFYLKILPLYSVHEWRTKIVAITAQFAPLLPLCDSTLPQGVLNDIEIQFIETFSLQEDAEKAVKLFEEVLAKTITLEIDLLHNCEYHLNLHKSIEKWKKNIQSLLGSKLNVVNFVAYKEQPRISVTTASQRIVFFFRSTKNIT